MSMALKKEKVGDFLWAFSEYMNFKAVNSASPMTSLYGSPKNENTEINTAKKVGYAISIFFLVLTVIIYVLIEDVRQVNKAHCFFTRLNPKRIVFCYYNCLDLP